MVIVYLFIIVASSDAREKTLKRLANIKDQDERDEYITGKASRTAYLASFSLLIFLLFISIFSVTIGNLPQDQAVNGKTGYLKIGFNFDLIEKPKTLKPSLSQSQQSQLTRLT